MTPLFAMDQSKKCAICFDEYNLKKHLQKEICIHPTVNASGLQLKKPHTACKKCIAQLMDNNFEKCPYCNYNLEEEKCRLKILSYGNL